MRISLPLFAVLTFLAEMAFAQTGQFDLSPPSAVEAETPGDTVVVPVTLSNVAGLAVKAFGFRFIFPNDKLLFQRVEQTETLTADWFIVDGQENDPGEITIGGFNTTAVTSSGVLLNVVFTTTETPGLDSLQLREFVDDIDDATTSDGVLNPNLSDVHSEFPTPTRFTLSQNYPNPFNPQTRIRFEIANIAQSNVDVDLSVYNVAGQLVRTLVSDQRGAGVYEVDWDGRNNEGMVTPSGMYFYTVRAGEFVETKRMLFLR